jgi:integrase
MATLRKKKGKRGATWEVLFYLPDMKRPTVRLGRVSQRIADTAKRMIEALVAARITGHSLDTETAAWVANVSDTIHQRLAKAGLVPPRQEPSPGMQVIGRLEAFVEGYIQSRTRLKPNTLRNYRTTKRILVEHFGKDRTLGSIHKGHARDYREWLAGKYAQANVSREIKRARQFFEYAKDCKLIDENPFAGVRAGSQKNSKRKHFVTRDIIDRVIEACPDTSMRLVVSLARDGALRIPSELVNLKWSDIEWARNRFTVHVQKKEHIDGHETRIVPIFGELRPHLERARAEAAADAVYVLPDIRSGEKNLRTGLLRLLEKVQIPAWPKLFQNLRASRETELMRTEPAHLVHAWVGNSEGVAEDHYLMATDEDFDRAAGKATLKATLSALISAAQALAPETRKAVSPATAKDTAVQVPPRGVEPRFSD